MKRTGGPGMQPEQGDRSVKVTRADVARAARAIGIMPGDTVFFHSSLSSMGTVVGGPDAVIDGFLDAVESDGTVAVPTLCNWKPGEQHLVFPSWDPAATPSYVGTITETLRLRPGAWRSDHATHSVAAIGGHAAELVRDHGAAGLRPGPFTARAFAHCSPWERLVQWNAAYCFIGVDFTVCTLVHYVEAVLAERAVQRAAPERRDAILTAMAGWMKPGPYPGLRIPDRIVVQEMLTDEGIVRTGRIGSTTFRCGRAGPMAGRWVAIIEAEPERWLSEEWLTLVGGDGGEA